MNRAPHALLLSPFFHPEPISTGRYNTHLAEYLAQNGYEVTVACSHPLYPRWKPEASDATLDGVRIERGGLGMRYPMNMVLRRALLEMWFAFHAMAWLFRLRGKVDVVVAVFPPSFFAALAQSFSRAPWVGVVHDLQGTFAGSAGGRGASIVAGIIHRIERRAFGRCRSLVFLSETMRGRAIAQYRLDPARCEVIYPGHNVIEGGAVDAALTTLLDDGRKHVVYAGALGHKQNPEGLLALFDALAASRPDVVCHVFSAGPIFEALRARSGRDAGVLFHDLVDESALATLLDRSTVHVINEVPGAGQAAIPSKVANLLWMAVPVFCVCDAGSELADLVMRSGIGHVDSTFDCALQLAALDRFVDRAATLDRPRQKARLRPLYAGLFSMHRMPAILDASRAQGGSLGPSIEQQVDATQRADATLSNDVTQAF